MLTNTFDNKELPEDEKSFKIYFGKIHTMLSIPFNQF